ncbi:MAG: 30S ribosomal protein S20 [Phycisphaerae bacterium]|nr:30S ribosomal protein S20 [Phycisphaerae bacterium]
MPRRPRRGDELVPNTQARKKQIRQDENRRARNRWRKRIIKTQVDTFLEAIQSEDVPAAEAAFKECQKQYDRISTTSTMHRNKAARCKSRLSRRLRDLKQKA